MRIRTIKPEWLEDERLSNASAEARVLSIALILLSDDFGRGRGANAFLGTRAFPNDPTLCADALAELVEIGFVRLYVVRDQRYFSVVNWSKHQRVDKPGKSQIPAPQDEEDAVPVDTDFTYFIVEEGKAVKIGRSWSPEGRLKRLQESTRRKLTLVGVIPGGWQEREMHRRFAEYQIGKREWFHLRGDLSDFLRDEFGFEPDSDANDSRTIRERAANSSEVSRSQPTPDLGPRTYGPMDPDREGNAGEPAKAPTPPEPIRRRDVHDYHGAQATAAQVALGAALQAAGGTPRPRGGFPQQTAWAQVACDAHELAESLGRPVAEVLALSATGFVATRGIQAQATWWAEDFGRYYEAGRKGAPRKAGSMTPLPKIEDYKPTTDEELDAMFGPEVSA
jgi:hypothetical protein